MRFIHTSDWHWGARLNAIGRRSSDSFNWRFDVVRRIYDAACDEGAEFIVVAGDIFDDADPDQRTRKKAIELIKEAPIPMYLIPGNHDPFLPGSVWTDLNFLSEFKGLTNVCILTSTEPVIYKANGVHVTILPAPVTFKHKDTDTSQSIGMGLRGDNSIRIGIAHGILRNYFGQEVTRDWITADRADLSGLDYLALGDFHGYTPDSHPAAGQRTRYCGAPEPLAVDQENAGYVLLVEIKGPGDDPVVKPIRVGNTAIVSMEERLTPAEGWANLRKKVEEIGNPGQTLLRLKVRGVLSISQYADCREWLNGLNSTLLGIMENSEELYREPSGEEWALLKLDPMELTLVDMFVDQEKTERFSKIEGGIVAAYAHQPSVRREILALLYEKLAR